MTAISFLTAIVTVANFGILGHLWGATGIAVSRFVGLGAGWHLLGWLAIAQHSRRSPPMSGVSQLDDT